MSDVLPEPNDGITRREFSLQSALAILSTCVITIDACGSNYKNPNNPTPTPAPTDITGSISANHGHTAVITAAHITDGNAYSLDIMGTATHPHTVDITQGDLSSLKGHQAVTKTSTTNSGHNHSVTFTPA